MEDDSGTKAASILIAGLIAGLIAVDFGRKLQRNMMRKLIFSACLFFLSSFGFSQMPVVPGPPPATYRASFSVACGGAGDCVTLYGSSSALVRIREVWFSKPSAAITVALIKRSTADTGGTSSALTVVPLDSNNIAATASLLAYTAAPTAGTAVGTILNQSVAVSDTVVQDYGANGAQPLTLHGTAEGLAINVSAAATVSGYFEWTER